MGKYCDDKMKIKHRREINVLVYILISLYLLETTIEILGVWGIRP